MDLKKQLEVVSRLKKLNEIAADGYAKAAAEVYANLSDKTMLGAFIVKVNYGLIHQENEFIDLIIKNKTEAK
jgi:hypothetical protein